MEHFGLQNLEASKARPWSVMIWARLTIAPVLPSNFLESLWAQWSSLWAIPLLIITKKKDEYQSQIATRNYKSPNRIPLKSLEGCWRKELQLNFNWSLTFTQGTFLQVIASRQLQAANLKISGCRKVWGKKASQLAFKWRVLADCWPLDANLLTVLFS